MKTYIGTKVVRAVAMTRFAYNALRGWMVPADENGADEGYLVEYLDGGKPNVPGYAGYVSWSPKEQFDKAYVSVANLSFGMALEALKRGHRVARAGWNGKGVWLAPVKKDEADKVALEFAGLDAAPWIGMKSADEKFVPWLASQTDVLANDWQVLT